MEKILRNCAELPLRVIAILKLNIKNMTICPENLEESADLLSLPYSKVMLQKKLYFDS